MRVLITRPIEDAEPLAEALTARGVAVQIEPLLEIRRTRQEPIDLDGVQAILVTSANGLRALAQLTSRRDIGVIAVGEASAQAARAAGFAAVDSAAGDVSSLISLVKSRVRPQNGALLHAAGSYSAGDLKGELEKAGYAVERVALYEAVAANEFSAALRANLSLGGIDGVLLFSPRTGRVFRQLWEMAGSPGLGRIAALCLSQAVGDEVGPMGWARVLVAHKPDLPSMLALVDAERERISAMVDSPSQSAAEVAPELPPAASAESEAEKPQPAPRKPGGGAGIATALLAGAVGGAAVAFASPYWLPVLGVGAEPSTSALEERIAAIDKALGDKPGAEAIADAVGPLRQQVDALRMEIDSARAELAGLGSTLSALQSAPAPADGDGAVATPAIDLKPFEERLAKLETGLAETALQASRMADAQAAPAQIAEAARQALEAENRALRDRIDELAKRIDEASALAPRLGEIEARLEEVPAETARQRAAALIVAIGQLQSALTDDRAFYAPLRTVQDLAIADQDTWDRLQPVIDVLAPYAEAGVPTRSQLAAGFPGTAIARAAEADLAGSLIEDAPWWKRLMHRLSEVVTVRPVGGDVEGDGPLERLARAEADLADGDLAAAVNEVAGIAGSAQQVAAEWLAQANARLAIDEAAATLSEMSARALEPMPGGPG